MRLQSLASLLLALKWTEPNVALTDLAAAHAEIGPFIRYAVSIGARA